MTALVYIFGAIIALFVAVFIGSIAYHTVTLLVPWLLASVLRFMRSFSRGKSAARRMIRFTTFSGAMLLLFWLPVAIALIAVAVALIIFPWALLRRWSIPNGHFRFAYYLGYGAWSGNGRAAALICGALAARRKFATPPKWLLERSADLPLTGEFFVYRGLIADWKGNREKAIAAMETALLFPPNHVAHQARAVATDWLATEFCAQGDKQTAIEVGREAETGSVAARIAAHLDGQPSSSLAPLLDHLDNSAMRTSSFGPVDDALRVTLQASSEPEIGDARRKQLAETWQAALLSDELMALVEAEQVTAEVEPALILDQVENIVERTLSEFGTSIAGAQSTRTAHTLDLEQLADDLLGLDDIPREQLCNRWLVCFGAYCSEVRSQGDVLDAYDDSHDQIGDFAVWLWNEKGEHSFSTALFRFLAQEAERAGDSRTHEWASKNS